ncbi:MAG: RelA/SpoT family protein [Anaerolineae bacterium]|nr:RelA/SpoT family protein [Anaerolineae bacterium]NIN95815.1 RelA/SpoT family protein [Anaerolineae bacterium]NIQ78781.1 RelA/SpoT family protein [Anaerolineae bacterium]
MDDPPTTLEGLLERAGDSIPAQEIPVIKRAYQVAADAHDGQLRASGEPFIQHSLATAAALVDMRLDPATIAAGLLHDVPEDTSVTVEQIRETFGGEIAKLVDGVTKLRKITWTSLEEEEAESLRKIFLAMVDDIRVILIRLADRLHNMHTLGPLPEDRRTEIARETLDIFAPLAHRLGMWQVKEELEDLALRYLEPERYQEVVELISERRTVRERYVDNVVEALRSSLVEAGIDAEVAGRRKHIYSIYEKMQKKGRDFDRIYDVHGARIIVEDIKDCYAALGIVHSLWRPIAGEFDDYIAMPKDNLYQSLHTAVVGPQGRPLEIQIRTWDMHWTAEYGVAAHWRYKEQVERDAVLEGKMAWLRQLMEWRRELVDAQEFVDSLKTDLFPEEVYVFTPKGDVIELPRGATPVDFAYHVHTEIGHRCQGAKVNGKIVPLNYQLEDGDQVLILTAKRGGPSRDWLNPHLGYVSTSRARQKIRQWFRRQERAENIARGRALLEKELKRLGIERESYEDIAKLFRFKKVEGFLAAIGYGDINVHQVSTRVLEIERESEEGLEELPPVVAPPTEAPGIKVTGVGDLLTHLGGCCNPLPGDEIIGYITRGRGVTIHRQDCSNVLRVLRDGDRERLIEVDWGEDVDTGYPVVVEVTAYDRKGLLKDIAAVLDAEDVNMRAATIATRRKDQTATIIATLEITGMDQLSRVLTKIESLTNVLEARRQTA